MARERILITVKTYPTLSTKYGETVCTAGIREDGSWVRLYPVPFRRLDEEQQYKKYDWIECELARSTKDYRPETRHPIDCGQLIPVGHMDTGANWRERRRLLLGAGTVYTSMESLILAARDNQLSLATYKPARIKDFVWEEDDRVWDETKLEKMKRAGQQGDLFEEHWRETFRVVQKVPYTFSYIFEDESGKERKLQVQDWETGALFYKCRRNAGGDEQVALKKVKQKYLDDFTKTDLHFFLGTTKNWHLVAPNPWIIIGVLPIPYELQGELNLI